MGGASPATRGKSASLSKLGWGPQKYTPPPRLGLENKRNWLVYTISGCICKLLQNTTLSIYTTPGPPSAPGVVYILTAVFYSSSDIHQEIVYTSHVPIFSKPKPGGGVYIWGAYEGAHPLKAPISLGAPERNLAMPWCNLKTKTQHLVSTLSSPDWILSSEK